MDRNSEVEKFIQIDKELCSGCGACIEVCTEGALFMDDNRAQLDVRLCTACEACLDACPNGAITAVITPKSLAVTASDSETDTQLIHPPQPAGVPASMESELGIKPYISATLTFLGSEIAPRLLDLLMKTIETRLAQSTANANSTSGMPSTSHGNQIKGQRKHLRFRGGKMKNGKRKGRR